MNDYFDLDFYYDHLKVSVKSSYFRIKERPSFVIYGQHGCFIKAKKDRQAEHLKLFYMPHPEDFGRDRLEDFGELTYIDGKGMFHQEKISSVSGDYDRVYDNLYDTIKNGRSKKVTDD